MRMIENKHFNCAKTVSCKVTTIKTQIVTLMGKRSFICRSSLGGQGSLYVHITFSVFGFLWYSVDVVIYGGAGSLSTFFFTMVHVSGIVSHLEFTVPYHIYINVTLFRLISLFMLIVFTYFCLGISGEDALLVKYLLCTICIFLRKTEKHDMCSG